MGRRDALARILFSDVRRNALWLARESSGQGVEFFTFSLDPLGYQPENVLCLGDETRVVVDKQAPPTPATDEIIEQLLDFLLSLDETTCRIVDSDVPVGEQISVNMFVVAFEMFLHTCNVLVQQVARNIRIAQLAFLDQVRKDLGQFGDLVILLVQQVQR
jgi:hypothetical protein